MSANSFEPFNCAYWNLSQVLAWVYLRSPKLVRQADDNDGLFYREVERKNGWIEHEPCGVVSVPDLVVLGASEGGGYYGSFGAAEDDLLNALREDKLRALGLPNGRGDLREISETQWAGLRFWYPADGPCAGPHNARAGATQWYGLRFTRSEVLELWPDPQSAIPEAEPPTPQNPKREHELHTLIKRAWAGLREKLKREPATEAIWKCLPDYNDDNILKEHTNDQLKWTSWRGNERTLQRTSFDSLMSRLRHPPKNSQ